MADQHNRYRGGFPSYLSAALGVFICSFFAVDSSKTINNFYYVFFGIPVVFFVFKNGFRWLGGVKQNLPIVMLFLHVTFVFLTKIGDPDTAFDYLKNGLYLAVLWLGLEISYRNEKGVALLWRFVAAICFAASLWAMAKWLVVYLHSNNASRITLFAKASNPVHASLLILVGWLGYWFKYGFPMAIERGKSQYLATLIFVVVFAFGVCVVFQSRSGVVGLVGAILVWLLVAKHFRLAASLLAGGAAIVSLSGLYDPLMQRGGSYRAEIWLDALQRLVGECSVLLGCPDDTNYMYAGQFNHPHSAYFSILVDSGITGAISFAAFALLYLRTSLRTGSVWFAVSMVGWGGVLATSNGLIESPRPLWVYFWIPTFLAAIEMKQRLNAEFGSTTVEKPPPK